MKWIDTLIQLRQQSVDNAQKMVAQLQGKLQLQETILTQRHSDFQSIQLPRQSSGAMLKQFSIQRDFALQSIKEQEGFVQKTKELLEKARQEYFTAHTELEQAKYIKADYVKKELYKAKQKEQKLIDELASQRFYINHKEVKENA